MQNREREKERDREAERQSEYPQSTSNRKSWLENIHLIFILILHFASSIKIVFVIMQKLTGSLLHPSNIKSFAKSRSLWYLKQTESYSQSSEASEKCR